jgi:hypothetical protein
MCPVASTVALNSRIVKSDISRGAEAKKRLTRFSARVTFVRNGTPFAADYEFNRKC